MACQCESCNFCEAWIGTCHRGYVFETCASTLPKDFNPTRPLCRGCSKAYDDANSTGNGPTPPSQAPAPRGQSRQQQPQLASASSQPRDDTQPSASATGPIVVDQQIATTNYVDQQMQATTDYVDQQMEMLRMEIQRLALQVAGSESVGSEWLQVPGSSSHFSDGAGVSD